MRYILITRDGCPYCTMAVDLLKEFALQYSVVNFECGQTHLLNEVKKAHDWETIPMIFVREENEIEFIGGYTELKKRLEKDD